MDRHNKIRGPTIKRNYPPIQVLLGLPVGKRMSIKCPSPMHRDSTPSFLIDEKGGFHCFGCGIHGKSALDFIIKGLGNSFKDSVKYLEDNKYI